MLAPEPTKVPPQLPVYHCQLAAVPRLPPLAESVAVPPEHTLVVVLLMELAAVEGAFVFTIRPEQVVVLQIPTALTK